MDKMYTCNICSFETHKSYNLKKHKKFHEKIGVGSPEMIECSQCDKSFITQKALNVHMKTHTEFSNEQGVNKYKCDKCPYITHKSYNLNEHKKIHDEAPLQSPEKLMYKCNICPYENKHKFISEKWAQTYMTLMVNMWKPFTTV